MCVCAPYFSDDPNDLLENVLWTEYTSFKLPYSGFRLAYSDFKLPYSGFRLPYSGIK